MARRLAVRCDGGMKIGAGHMARCRPLALAFAQAGWEVTAIGRLGGFARWLADDAGLEVTEPAPGAPCGVEPERFDAAIVDLYGTDVCPLARVLPVATPGEAARCDDAGIHIDYHLDRLAAASTDRVLAGPGYAPVDSRFATIRRDRGGIEQVLVTLGASELAATLGPAVLRAVASTFPDAGILAAQGLPPLAGIATTALPQPATLLEPARRADAAVTAAGMTAYELACAGVPFVAVVIADNQRRVADALEAHDIAPVVDVRAGIDEGALEAAIGTLRDARARASRAARGMAAVDGAGARRAMEGLCERWATGAAGRSEEPQALHQHGAPGA